MMEKLFKVLKRNRPVSIAVHNNPDPDALASAMGLRYLLNSKDFKRVRIYYHGLIGRAENQAMIKNLRVPLSKTKNMTSPKKRQFILVDCQPSAGNITLPPGIKPVASIDHHPKQRKTSKISYSDIRPEYGSCSAIIYEYFSSLGISLPQDIATALFYAIFSETQGLGREGSKADKDAYLELLPQISFS
jgi:nanoRNase/pAp phosphatase (c-di-AMP/oligoRNAs hydrolase)